MTKRVVGTSYRPEGARQRLHKVIQCEDCGYTTYQRRQSRVDKVLASDCVHCHSKDWDDYSLIRDGRTKHPLYLTYQGMLSRCYNENQPHYDDYGGRGISVCLRWIVDFWAFVEDMGDKPSPLHSIDRVDNDGIYHPLNIRWATKKEQQNNRRCSKSHILT